MRGLAAAFTGLTLSDGFYLLLIDTPNDVELFVLAAAVILSTLAFMVSREQGFTEARIQARWLWRVWRVVLSVPAHIAILCREALAQLFSRRAARGVFRAVPFAAGADEPRDVGRRALAEAIGSIAPNTIVIGVDPDRRLLLVHQLHRQGGREQLDPLELG